MNRITQLLAALGLALATQACQSPSPTFTGTPPGTPSPVLSLKFDSQPASGLAGETLPVKVSIRDANGQATGAASITVALASNLAGSALSGTVTRAAVNGVATFDDLVIVKAGQDYTLTASAAGVTQATTSSFTLAYSADEQEMPGSGSNDTAAGAEAITPSIPMFGALSSPEDVDFYKFHATKGQILSLSSYATRLDLADWDTSLRLRLVGADGSELQRMSAADWEFAMVDNGFTAVRIPADGDYYLACDVDASGSLLSATAKYALVLKLANGPDHLQLEAEPANQTGANDSIATAQALTAGIVYGAYQTPGQGASSTQSDFYKISIDAATRIHLDLIGGRNGIAKDTDPANPASRWDALLELQDSSGVVLWRNDDTVFLDPAIDYVITVPGTYYVRVGRTNDDDTGTSPYLLTYDASAYAPAQPSIGANTTALSAMPLSFAQYVQSDFGTSGGQQFFVFDGNDGDLVRLWVQDESHLQGSTLQMAPSLAADAMFLDSEQAPVAFGQAPLDSTPPASSEFNVRQIMVHKTGPQYVRVSSPTGGKFGIRLERVAAAGTPGFLTGVLPKGATAELSKNHHSVHAEEGQLLTVSVLANAASLDCGSRNAAGAFGDWGSALCPTVQVNDAQGNKIAGASADRLGLLNFAESVLRPDAMLEVSFRAPKAGDYDVVVADANGFGGPAYFYALQVWKNQ